MVQWRLFPAVLTSVTTTMVAFSPLLLVSGNMEFMYEMAFVVVACLSLSLFESLFCITGSCGQRKGFEPRSEGQLFLTVLEEKLKKGSVFVRDHVYTATLDRIVRWRWFCCFLFP